MKPASQVRQDPVSTLVSALIEAIQVAQLVPQGSQDLSECKKKSVKHSVQTVLEVQVLHEAPH